jgi:hypothetical protein
VIEWVWDRLPYWLYSRIPLVPRGHWNEVRMLNDRLRRERAHWRVKYEEALSHLLLAREEIRQLQAKKRRPRRRRKDG